MVMSTYDSHLCTSFCADLWFLIVNLLLFHITGIFQLGFIVYSLRKEQLLFGGYMYTIFMLLENLMFKKIIHTNTVPDQRRIIFQHKNSSTLVYILLLYLAIVCCVCVSAV